MIVLLLTKLLSDIGYYFVFANYIGGYIGVNYSFALSVGALSLAGALSGALEKKGIFRLLPPAAATLLLLQCRCLMDFVVLLPPLIYVWIVCIKKIFVPDGNEYKELFSLQLKTLIILPFIFVFKPDMAILRGYCLPSLIMFLLSAVLAMRMMRHNTQVLKTPAFQIRNALTVGAVLVAAWGCTSNAFLRILGKVVAAFRWVLLPVVEGLGIAISYVFALFMQVVMAFFAFLGRTFGNDNFEKSQIEVQEGIKEEMDLLDGYIAPDSRVFSTVIMVILIIVGLICMYFIFKRMLYRRGRQDTAGFEQQSLTVSAPKTEKDRLIAPKDPREAVRWHYRRFLRYCKSKDMTIKPSHDSREINALAVSRDIAESEQLEPLREVYIAARYSDREITQQDVNQAKDQLKRIKDGR